LASADWAPGGGDVCGSGVAGEGSAAAGRQRLEGAESALAEARRGVGEAFELLSEGARRVQATVDVVGCQRRSNCASLLTVELCVTGG